MGFGSEKEEEEEAGDNTDVLVLGKGPTKLLESAWVEGKCVSEGLQLESDVGEWQEEEDEKEGEAIDNGVCTMGRKTCRVVSVAEEEEVQ